MGTTADKLVYLEETKADIRAALVEKGMDVPESTPFRGYGDLIRGISGDSLATVGDVKFTVRKDLGSDWLLCDGSMVDLENYPGLDICMQGTSDWEKITMPSDFGTTFSEVLAANDLLFVVGASNALWYSTSPKGPWAKKADTLSGLYNKRFVYFAGKYCSVDNNGNMYTTPDMGTNWTKEMSYAWDDATNVIAFPSSLFILTRAAAGYYGIIYRTESYGERGVYSETSVSETNCTMVSDGKSILIFDTDGNSNAEAVLNLNQSPPPLTKTNMQVIAAAATENYFFVSVRNGSLYRSKSIADFAAGNRELLDIAGNKQMFADGKALMLSTPGADDCKIINEETLEVLKTPGGTEGTLSFQDISIGKNGVLGMRDYSSGVYAPKQNHLTAPQLPNLVGNGSLAYIKAK